MARGTEIISIFGQCERVAASMLADKYNLRTIAPADFPDSVAQTNAQGDKVSFALILPRKYQAEFNDLILELRA